MKLIIRTINTINTLVGAILGWYFGNPDGFFNVLVTFVIVDYIAGVIRASISGKLDSSIGYKGIAKKIMIFVIVGMAHVVDMYVLSEASGLTRTAVIFFYISNEGISILENSHAIGIPIPHLLKKALKKINTDTIQAEATEQGGDK
ncbi:phage holin family protein [Facklamia languida]